MRILDKLKKIENIHKLVIKLYVSPKSSRIQSAKRMKYKELKNHVLKYEVFFYSLEEPFIEKNFNRLAEEMKAINKHGTGYEIANKLIIRRNILSICIHFRTNE